MSEFEILGEVEGVGGCDVSVALEVEHRSGITGKPETTEQLGDDVEGDLNVGNGHDDTKWYAESGGKKHPIQHCGGGGVGGVGGDTSGANNDGGTQDDQVDPLGNLFV